MSAMKRKPARTAAIAIFLLAIVPPLARSARQPTGYFHSPASSADAQGRVWTAWVESTDDGQFIRVFGPDGGLSPAVNAPFTASAAAPCALADGRGGVWIIWTGRDAGRDEIMARRLSGPDWSPIYRLNADARVPHVRPAVSFGPTGNPVAVWSAYDGRRYVRFSSVWNGDEWSPEARVPGSDSPEPTPVAAEADRDANQYVAFGDSITYGGGFYGYPPRLELLLADKYGTAKVWNAGVGGEITEAGLARIDYILSGTNSEYLLLMEGTNDAADLRITIDTIDFNLREMCRRALAAGWTPLLGTITPRSDTLWYVPAYYGRFLDLNTRIRMAAADLEITLVDTFEEFMSYPADLGGYTALLLDGVHPNSVGYQLLAETWFAALKVVKFNPPEPPLLPALETSLDATETRKVNVLTWQANPLNASMVLGGYQVYRKKATEADSAFVPVGAIVPPATPRYEDASLDILTKYAYRVTALSSVWDESAPSETVTETKTFAFPPLNAAVRSGPSKGIPVGRGFNIVTFAANPLNESAAVSGYRVYRKSRGQSDSQFTAIAALGPTTYRFFDLFVPPIAKYAYAVTTLLKDGQESKKSATVSVK
jgi:lysophospholipase L1-like esterase